MTTTETFNIPRPPAWAEDSQIPLEGFEHGRVVGSVDSIDGEPGIDVVLNRFDDIDRETWTIASGQSVITVADASLTAGSARDLAALLVQAAELLEAEQ